MKTFVCALFAVALSAPTASAAVILYGDKDVLGTGVYAVDPVTGATLEGLQPGVTTVADLGLGGLLHTFPFSPDPGDFPGTDQIYIGNPQTYPHDGYSLEPVRTPGPQQLAMDYSAAIPAGHKITTLTLGLAFDDFQFPLFSQPDPNFPGYPLSGPYTITVNGVVDPVLSQLANLFLQTGPRVSFATIGIRPALLNANHLLTVMIDQGGSGGDGWAVDFVTVGVTTRQIPEPATLGLGLMAAAAIGLRWRRRT